MAKLKEADLRGGMKVKNARSGLIGELISAKIYPRHFSHDTKRSVYVRVRIVSGKNKGRLERREWNLENLERV